MVTLNANPCLGPPPPPGRDSPPRRLLEAAGHGTVGPGEPTATPGLESLYGGNKSGPGPGWAGGGAARPGPGPPGAGSSARIPPEAGVAPPSHLARCPRPLRAGAGRASVSRRLWVRPAGRGLQGPGGSGRVKTVQAGGGLGGPGPADPAPRLPPCRTVTSCCRPCSPRPGCAPWRCPRTCSWTAGAPRVRRPSACEPPGFRSRSAPASCSWASSPGTTGPPSPTGSPGRPEVGGGQQGGRRAVEAQRPRWRAGGGRGGARARGLHGAGSGFSSLTH